MATHVDIDDYRRYEETFSDLLDVTNASEKVRLVLGAFKKDLEEESVKNNKQWCQEIWQNNEKRLVQIKCDVAVILKDAGL